MIALIADQSRFGPGAEEPPRTAEAHVPRSDEAHGLAWLTWRSKGCDHGIRGHKIALDGSIIEMVDPAPRQRKKPKEVSSKQWKAV